MKALKFGLLAETRAQLNDLGELVLSSGHEITLNMLARTGILDDLVPLDVPTVDAWVVRLDLQHDNNLVLIERLESFDVPVIYDDIESYAELGLSERVHRFARKLQVCAGTGIALPKDVKRAEEVWVLVASTGGPEAVGRFLKTLPEDLAGVAFVYVQHINPEITGTLQKALVRNTTWPVLECERSHQLVEKCVYIVSPEHQVDVHAAGVIAPMADAWIGCYHPSADQVMAKVARSFGKRSGAIIFSGMGDDGANSCPYMKGSGGVIWAQSPLSCTVDSMPVCAIKTGMVTYQGSPENLARQFVYGRHIPTMASRQ